MSPGTYLERRRVMAGYSNASLARELIALTGFGTQRTLDDLRRLQLTLIAAEQDTLHHSADRIDLIRNFVPLDPAVYFRLIELHREAPGLTIHGVCRVCACSFHDPCTLPVDPAAGLGTSTCCWVEADLCSACSDAARTLQPRVPTLELARPSIAEQLRDLGDRMARLNQTASAAEQPALRLVPNTGEH